MRIRPAILFVVLAAASGGLLSASTFPACPPGDGSGTALLSPIDLGSISGWNAASQSGCFVQDDNEQDFTFTLASESQNFSAYTTQWANGNNGFASVLSLFDSSGNLIVADTLSGDPAAGTCGFRAVDPVSGACLDAYLSADLLAGSYTLVLTQWANTAIGTTYSGGFAMAGTGNYTQGFAGQSTGACYAPDNSLRSCNFSLQIDAATPEPFTGLLGISGLLVILAMSRRLRQTFPADPR